MKAQSTYHPVIAGILAVTLGLFGFAGSTVAQQKPTLTVYTYNSWTSKWGPGPKVKANFEAVCACTVEYVALEDGVALLSRLKLEGARSKADIILGLDQNLVTEAKRTGLFAPHDISLNRLALPVAWADDTFVPYDHGAFAVIYDSQKLPNPPKSLKELVEGDPSQKIILQDPRTSTPGLGMLLWMRAVYGDAAPEQWAQLRRRVLTVTKGWSEAYGLFTKGEAPMVLSYTTSPAYHLMEEKSDRYKAAIFAEGHYPQIELVARLKSSANAALARQFLDFALSDGFQTVIPTTNWMYPAVALDSLPEAFRTLPKPASMLTLPFDQIADQRRAWTDEWLKAMGQ